MIGKATTRYGVPRLLELLDWSTSQGDAAVLGADASDAGVPVSACPYPPASTLTHPWRAGWLASQVEAAAPATFRESRSQGHVEVIVAANGSAGRLAGRLWGESLDNGQG